MNSRTNPTWYKDAIIYELHVRAFYDSITDGMGDFGGLTQKLDYLEDLGVTAIWLLPFCPSPWKDDGYDISDYTDVHPAYGSLADFQRFLKEAHRRNMKVITELVLNHTSDQHIWFQRSRRAAPGSRWRNFYVWSDTPEKYKEARIIFKDFETSNWTWDPVAKSYYWHRFYSHQPDLNWDNPEVREAMFSAMDFWLDMGVDGLRLDAVPYLIEREGTNCENLKETHDILRQLRERVDKKYSGRMLLAEANQWPEDSVAYFGKGDECHMAFHFPVMPRLFMALRMEDRYPILDILRLTPAIPESCQWAMFLRNHDELTLEMVTDEERDYMYRSYAHDRQMRINLGIRRRLAPLLENDRRKIELMNALLLSLPGTPVIYYGDEIGMGDNVYLGDRNGVRTPMQWSADRNAGFSRANPQRLYLPVNIDPQYHYEAINVEAQQNNPHSLLWWMKRIIAQRKQFKAFGRGTLEFLHPPNNKVLAFVRQYEDEKVLVVANLSRFAQAVELDLSKFKDVVPVEVFGRSRFPSVGDQPYFLSLGPYAFHWFHMRTKEANLESLTDATTRDQVPVLTAESEEDLFSYSTWTGITRLLPRLLPNRAWFLGRNRYIREVNISEVIRIPETRSYLLLTDVEYVDGDPDTYLLALSLASGETAEAMLRDNREGILARVSGFSNGTTIVYGAVFDRQFADGLLTAMVRRKKIKSDNGELHAGHTRVFRKDWARKRSNLDPQRVPTDHPNTYIRYGEDFALKLYRRLEAGTNPGREILEFLTEHTDFCNVPRALGWLEYRQAFDEGARVTTLGVLTSYARNGTNGWPYMLDHLGLYFERALAIPQEDARVHEAEPPGDVLTAASQPFPPVIADLFGTRLETILKLGQRTAELHQALSSSLLPEFVPEQFTDFYRHGLFHGMLGHMGRTFDALRTRVPSLNGQTQQSVRELLARENEVRQLLAGLRDERIHCTRIRHHGDFHLGHLQFTGNDVMIMDFDGDPNRPMSERRIKRSALRDVASMMRSFSYISSAVLYGQVPGIIGASDRHEQLERWAAVWRRWMSALFLRSYLETAGNADFVPNSLREKRILIQSYLLEKCLFEINYELEYRPDWLRIPVQGILDQLQVPNESAIDKVFV